MTILKKGDRLGASDRGAPARGAHDFGDGWQCEIFSAAGFASFLDDFRLAVFKRTLWIDPWTVLAVCEQTGAVRIDTRRERGAVDVGGGRVSRMMMAKGYAFPRELPKRGSVALGDEIRTHAVPDDYDDVAIVFFGCVRF